MAIDLSDLQAATKPAPAASPAAAPSPAPAATGEPLELPIGLIDEDPNQPRREFTPEKMAEMVASIEEHGVIQPVSVRPNPDAEGRWILNFGARRYRGSKEAGKKTVPAFVHLVYDDYKQVIENLQREDLKPIELALYIQRKIDEGEKKNAIAKKLGIPKSTITYHMALIGMPAEIETVYVSGRCTSPTTLYDLRALHEKHAEQVNEWLATDTAITRATVQALSDALKGKRGKASPVTATSTTAGGAGGDENAGSNGGGSSEGDNTLAQSGEGGEGEGGEKAAGQGSTALGQSTSEVTSWPPGKVGADPDLMKRPLLLVEFDGRSAAVLLNRRPSEFGLLRIKYEDNGEEAEIDAGQCKINSLRDEKP